MSLHISSEEHPTDTTEKMAEVKDATSGMADVGLKWGGNRTAFQAELKASIGKVVLTSYSVTDSLQGSEILLLFGYGELGEFLFTLLKSLILYWTFKYSCNYLHFKTSWTYTILL